MSTDLDQSRQFPGHQTDEPDHSRDAVIKKLKLELLTGTDGSKDERGRGFDPYNSRLGSKPKDVWSQRRRA